MKEMLLLLTVLSVLKQNANSQHSYGLKAGPSLSNQNKTFSTFLSSTSSRRHAKPFLGYQFGAFYKAALNTKWAFSAEVNNLITGSKIPFLTEEMILSGDSVTHYLTDKMGYIEIPLTLQYSFTKVYLGVGPGIGYKIYAKIKHFESRIFNSTYFRNLDVAAILLTGYRISKKWDINLRYRRGLLNIRRNNNYENTKNHYLNLSMLYLLH